ncbi:peptidylprolyl isomerase [Deinococcus fonticola]|uniref:peptidylprolyl isomerase n=1 Tax=Deinococcus fonticola TaxID=2528713 RepID=UPI001F0D3DA1|nr:peptidylprolyl isomerase [Deinococcus fonticola]
MSRNKRLQQGLMGLLAVLMVGGMAYQFTPALSGNGGGLFGQKQQGTPAVKVGDQTVTAEELNAFRNNNPVLAGTQTGVLGDDFKLFTVRQLVQQKMFAEGAKAMQVSRDEVNKEVDQVRKANNLEDNKAWTDALQSRGLTDSSFRQQVRESLAIRKKVEEIEKSVPAATDAELRTYYDLNKEQFKTDPQIVGRQIVVADKAKAEALLRQLKGGADFARLASENSSEFKERGGALGPIENGSPKPVASVVLPGEVAAAAFALTQGGLTDVVASGGKYYIVKVEKYLPAATKPFEATRTQVKTAVDRQKKDAALEAWADSLEKATKVEYVDPEWKVTDPTVASLAGHNIPYSDVVAQVVNNQQLAQMFSQMPPEQLSDIINSGLKPQVVQQLLQGYAAPLIAKKLNLNLVGNRAEMAQALSAYGAKDVKVTEAELQAAYQQNLEQFKTPASASVDEASFKDQGQAQAFRADWNGQGDFTTAATKAGATVSERGSVTAGDGKLDAGLDKAVQGDQLRAAGEGSLTPAVKVGQRYSVAYVRDLKKAATRPYSEVKAQLEQQVLGDKQRTASLAFLDKQVKALNPTDNLKKILDDQAKRVAAAEKAAGTAPTTPGTNTPGTTSTPGAVPTTPPAATDTDK